MNKTTNYTLITESSGLKATREQVKRLFQRYHFARKFANGKDVLEVACGSGIGLGYLAKVANKVVGVDIEEKNVALARKYYVSTESCQLAADSGKIEIQTMDAHCLNFRDKCFDIVVLFEAIYYLKDPQRFISEAERVLRVNGKLIICTVNKDWEDFHPSPYTHKYFSVTELFGMLKDKFNEVEVYGGFPLNNKGLKNRLLSLIKRTAVNFKLIPGSLKTRAYLKRVFMGKLTPLPAEVYEDMVPYEAPTAIVTNKNFKIIYVVAGK